MSVTSDSRTPQFEFLTKHYSIPNWLHDPSTKSETVMKQDATDAVRLINSCKQNLEETDFETVKPFTNRLSTLQEMISSQITDYDETISTEKLRTNFYKYIHQFFLSPPVTSEELKQRVTQGHTNSSTCSVCANSVWALNRHTCRCCTATVCSWHGCARERPFSQINSHPQFSTRTFDVTLCQHCSSPASAWSWMFRKLILLAKLIAHAKRFVELINQACTTHVITEDLKRLDTLIGSDFKYDTHGSSE